MIINFNPAQYEPFSGYDLLNAGDYPVIITDIVPERTKDQTGGFLKIVFTVTQGHPAAGRTVYDRLNLWNNSPKAAEIAHKQLTALCYSVGIMQQLPDTDMLKNRPMIITVGNDGKYNSVDAYKDAQGNQPGKAAQGGAQQPGVAGQVGMPQFGQPQAAPQAFQQPQQAFAQPQAQAQPQVFQQPQGNPFGALPNPVQQGMQSFAQPQSAPPYAQSQQPQQTQPMPFPSGQQPGFVQPQAQQPQNPQQNFQQQPPQGFTGFPGQ